MSLANRIERATDFAVGLVSPRRRAIRAHLDRMATDPDYKESMLAVLRARGYRAASDGKYGTPFLGNGGTADAQVIGDLPALYSRSRELNRDDPIACGLTWTFVRNVIGTGMRPQSRTPDSEKNAKHEAVWAERCDLLALADDMTHAEHQRCVFWKVLEDGGVLVKKTTTDGDDGVWFEVIEKDRIGTPPGMIQSRMIVDGVKKDEYSRVQGYHVLKSAALGGGLGAREYEFVPKSQARHLRLATRPGQTHGVPAYHAVTKDLRDLDLLILAALKRVQVSACLSAFITSEKKMDDLLEVTAQANGYRLDQGLEPGMLFKLYPGESIETLIPNFPNSEFEPFIVLLARRIGAALGVSWQIVLKDFSQSTYSSARTDLLEARQAYRQYQSWFADKLLRWEWVSVLEDARLRGDKRLSASTPEEIAAVQWIPNGWRWIDPQNEVAATELELKLGITTLQEVCASQGKDWEEVMRQRLIEQKREREMREELGVEAEEKKGDADAGDVQAD